MDTAKQHWEILQRLGTDLANRVREFLVIGKNGEGVIVATEDGLGFWLGQMKFGSSESGTTNEPISLDVPGLVRMAHNENHILLLNKRGEIYSMGKNDDGQLGLGIENQEVYFSPQLISIPQHKFISVRCGVWHSVALTEDGKCWAWGANHCGQVGVPSSTANSLPSPSQLSQLDPHRVVAVECGAIYSLALTDRGEVYAWGGNDCGQLGDGSTSNQHTPTRIPIPSPVQSMAAGDSHTLLLTRNGEVWACGDNGWGQLGLIGTEISTSLSKVEGLPSISQIAAHPTNELSVALSFDKRCYVWGRLDNEFDEEKCILKSTPRKLPPFYSTVDSPLSFFSTFRSTPHSVTIPETSLSLSARMSRMFDNPESSDVQFVVEQRTIHAHPNILSNSSDYNFFVKLASRS